jgi:hypothetical protein
LDGLNYYKQSSDSDWKFTLNVENSANEVLKLIALYGDQPNSAALAAAHELLDDIEKWKAICLKERMGQRPWHHPFDRATQGTWVISGRGIGSATGQGGNRCASVLEARELGVVVPFGPAIHSGSLRFTQSNPLIFTSVTL